MSLARFAVVAAVATLLAPGGRAAARQAPPADPFVQASNAFAVDLYQRLRAQPGNFFFSPASVSAALTMTWAGARGDTAAEMARVLHLGQAPAKVHAAGARLVRRLAPPAATAPEVRIANRLWVQQGLPLEPAFAALVAEHYGAGVEPVDFVGARETARVAINRWVGERTAGRITDLLAARDLDGDARLVLTNAIHFKGTWVSPFDSGATRPAAFTVAPGTTPTVPLMHATLEKEQVRYAAVTDAQVLELPYRSERRDRALAMVVVLPRAVDGLARLEAGLTARKLQSWVTALKPAAVSVYLPRFGVSRQLALAETLVALGMKRAFAPRGADFSGLTRKEPICLARVQHQAVVRVTEQGTEAAAATAVTAAKANGGGGPPPFRADHPFVFFIRDVESGAILFLGRLVDPRP
jgi:serpin B